jgi:hypothetical protein
MVIHKRPSKKIVDKFIQRCDSEESFSAFIQSEHSPSDFTHLLDEILKDSSFRMRNCNRGKAMI